MRPTDGNSFVDVAASTTMTARSASWSLRTTRNALVPTCEFLTSDGLDAGIQSRSYYIVFG